MNDSAVAMVVRRICVALPRYAYRFNDEKQLHEGIARVLELESIGFAREYVAGDDRFDFLCEEHVVIEAKVEGSLSAALRQAERYCRQDQVQAVIVVSSRAWRGADRDRPAVFHLKPVHFVRVQGQAF